MDNKTEGSWLIHNTNKLQSVTNQSGYEKTFLAGKAGILLSAISANDNITIDNDRLNALAQAANINLIFELPKLVEVLKEGEYIDTASKGIAVLGVTGGTVLSHTSDIFHSLDPKPVELATLDLAENVSLSPEFVRDLSGRLSDEFKLSSAETTQLFSDAESIGFVDVEDVGNSKLLFNGNLFRRNTAQKIKNVLDSLKPFEQTKLTEMTELLKRKACISVDTAQSMLGDALFQKVTAIGIFDINVVSNSTEDVGFMTLPSAFSKFSNSMVDDAFDLAKAFVSSITYGMTKSSNSRGQITMVEALLATLVRGEPVGPVPAIAEDYKILEMKGVVRVSPGSKKGRYGPMLTLLKKEVGELALQAIRQGDVSEHSLTALPSAAVTKFQGPEQNREKVRKKQTSFSPKATNDMLTILRTGGKL
ncbi:hypothetical protein GCM10007423_39230 [Dyadobacter endophyticus]|uniref:Uncharacterized protein n=1 Tax=Dyadobacter endophyticus TaxID=1749036 RepID=A0ABQ1YZC6_9BACT|nr:hypothetical protein [Dyadobacter endophyticus]GGH42547.1 hypothetical protein GCM10007423_39230 [Dyadobacter endophyticus]